MENSRRSFFKTSGSALTIAALGGSAGALLTGCNQPKHKAMKHGKKKMKDFRAVPMEKAQIIQEGKSKLYCPVCGMTLPMFYRTNHAADVDGKTTQYCSIHCAYEDVMLRKGKGAKPEMVQAVDNESLKFIPAASAYYVVGSNRPATMSSVSKYAFATKKGAEDFSKMYGGDIMNYDETSKIVSASLEATIAMIKKRQRKAAKRGEGIYNKLCKQDGKTFSSPADAKAHLVESKICGNLKGKDLQHVGLFLAGR